MVYLVEKQRRATETIKEKEDLIFNLLVSGKSSAVDFFSYAHRFPPYWRSSLVSHCFHFVHSEKIG